MATKHTKEKKGNYDYSRTKEKKRGEPDVHSIKKDRKSGTNGARLKYFFVRSLVLHNIYFFSV